MAFSRMKKQNMFSFLKRTPVAVTLELTKTRLFAQGGMHATLFVCAVM